MGKKTLTPAEHAISALEGAEISSPDIARIVRAALARRDRLAPEEMALCTGLLLDKLRAVPMRDTIYLSEDGALFLAGKPVKDPDAKQQIIAAARAAYTNVAHRLIKEKVEYAASVMARNAATTNDLIFAKAALWFVEQMDEVFEGLIRSAGEMDIGIGE